jgi:diguanylate cyclase (GGDEF)-like protein
MSGERPAVLPAATGHAAAAAGRSVDRARRALERHPRFLVAQARALRPAITTASVLMAAVIALNGVDLAARHAAYRDPIALGACAEMAIMLCLALAARRAPRWALEPLAALLGYVALGAMVVVAVVVYHGLGGQAYSPTYVALAPVALALLIPWSSRTNLGWLLGYMVTVAVFLASPLARPVEPTESSNMALALVVGVALSYFGNRALYRARIEVFGQGLRLRAQRAELSRLNREIATSALTDPLTGVPNRRSLDDELGQLWDRVVRYGHSYAALMIDLDRFKPINDRRGHAAGDAALRTVAQALHALMRTGDELYRYGGEEFVVLLPAEGIADARSAAERFKGAVAALGIPNPDNPPWGLLTISVGLAVAHPGVDADAGAWFARADAALYRAKDAGRNHVEADAAGEGTPRTGGDGPGDRRPGGAPKVASAI